MSLIPRQAEKIEEGGWIEPAGFHLIPLPFADDIRAVPDPVLNAARGELTTGGARPHLLRIITMW